MEIKIIASTGQATGQAIEIRSAKFFIGHHDNCQIRPDLAGLAGIHALIEQRDDRLYLRDFGAEGGTGINDRVLHLRETEVFNGDMIQIGPMVLTLSVKAKGEDTHFTMREAPEGWPYLKDLAVASPPVVARPAPVMEGVSAEVVAQALHESETAPVAVEYPSRLSAFLAREAAVAVNAGLTEAPLAVATAPRPVTPALSHPIVTRTRSLRAITCHEHKGVTVVTLLGPELNEEETVSPVRYELRTLIDEDEIPPKTVIDLGHTKYLSSRAVGVLLAHFQALDRQGGMMRVCQVSKEIKPVIDQMRLSKLVDIYPTLEEAIDDPWE